MRVLILGATGRLGGRALDATLAAGHSAIVLTRDPSRIPPREALDVVGGDIGDQSSLGGALAGVDAVLSALGPRANDREEAGVLELGARHLVAAMDDHGVRRLVALSGAGVDAPGDAKPLLDRLASKAVQVFARYVLEAKQREFDVIAGSGLDWTALRPPLVTDGAPAGYLLTLQLRPGARVTRADIGQALADQLVDRAFIRSAPFVLPAPKAVAGLGGGGSNPGRRG